MGMIKTEKEIKLLRKSAHITDSCIKVIENSLKEVITEKELRRRIGRKIRSQSASLSFQTIVACGKRSAIIHPKPHATDNLVKGMGYADFGASYRGYKTDITVPFIKGRVGEKEKRIVETTLSAYRLALSSIKLGVPCWQLFQKIYKYQESRGFELKHGLGHGIGLKIHERPLIVVPKKEKLRRGKSEKKIRKWEGLKKVKFQKNMVFTIEPGVYVKGLGGCRLENDVLLISKRPKVLTHAKLIVQ